MLSTNKSIWKRMIQLVLPYWATSSVRFSAWRMVAFLVAIWGAESYVTYLCSNASNHMMTALSEKHIDAFWHEMLFLAGSYVGLTAMGVGSYYLRKIVELNWREWLTTFMLDKYLRDRSYYRITAGNVIDNPDERLSRDISSFVGNTLSFFDIIISNTMSVFTYCIILWKIWPPLIALAFGFAIAASAGSIIFGKRLALKQLNFSLIKNEADFRYELFHLRSNAESVAFYAGESEKRRSLLNRFSQVIQNCKQLFKMETIYDCYLNIYRHLTNWLPLLILAPRFFSGSLKLGDLTQAQGAFSTLLYRCSIIVNFYDWFASYAAVVERLAEFSENTDLGAAAKAPTRISSEVISEAKATGSTTASRESETKAHPITQIITIEKGELAISQLRLSTPGGKKLLVDDLNINLQAGKSLAIAGPPGGGKTALLRAISGLWQEGHGLIIRPSLAQIMFLPQKPYMPIGTLREQLCFPKSPDSFSDAQLFEVLDKVNLPELVNHFGGLDVVARWQDELSPGQQQLIAFSRVLLKQPELVILDEATGALDSEHEALLYEMLLDLNVSFVSIVHKLSALKYHDFVLELAGDGSGAYKIVDTEDYLDLELAQGRDRHKRTGLQKSQLVQSNSNRPKSQETDESAEVSPGAYATALRLLLQEHSRTNGEAVLSRKKTD